jgi:hypothetical protein
LTKFLVNRRKFFVAACAAGAMAQEGPTFSAGVKVVNVFVTVRDKNGQTVRDLRKEDFAVRENGKPQSIRYFSRESDLPLAVALLVDTSLSQGRVLENERGASYRFLDQVLREIKDQAVIVQFDQAIVRSSRPYILAQGSGGHPLPTRYTDGTAIRLRQRHATVRCGPHHLRPNHAQANRPEGSHRTNGWS